MKDAKKILKKAPIEGKRYADVKYVQECSLQEACATAYLAILKEIDGYLLNKGLSKKELPKSMDAYRSLLRKHLMICNGKLMREFEDLYDELHMAGYYRGNLHSVGSVKEIFKATAVPD